MPVVEILSVVFLGLVLGSFATALVYRVPRDLPWWSLQRSVCPSCSATLQVRDLVPVFSWAFLKGKCRHCGHTIPIRYPVIELATLAACLGIYAVYGFTPPAFFMMALIPFLMALLVIDLDTFRLPNSLVAITAAIGAGRAIFLAATLGVQAAFPLVVGMILFGALAWVLGAVMTRVLKREALGFGDVKFFAMAGLWLGVGALPGFLLLSGVLGVALGLLWRKIKGEGVFPFGPALIASLYVLLLFGGSLLP